MFGKDVNANPWVVKVNNENRNNFNINVARSTNEYLHIRESPTSWTKGLYTISHGQGNVIDKDRYNHAIDKVQKVIYEETLKASKKIVDRLNELNL